VITPRGYKFAAFGPGPGKPGIIWGLISLSKI